jgi:hypothetical protein
MLVMLKYWNRLRNYLNIHVAYIKQIIEVEKSKMRESNKMIKNIYNYNKVRSWFITGGRKNWGKISGSKYKRNINKKIMENNIVYCGGNNKLVNILNNQKNMDRMENLKDLCSKEEINKRVRNKILGSIYYGGANTTTGSNRHKKELEYLLTNEWLSNVEIDDYLEGIQNISDVTIHHSDVSLLLQGGAGEFADTNHTHPSHWGNVNIIPTIIRSSDYVGVHWVLLEIIMSSRNIKLYDPLGIKQRYQTEILNEISKTLCEEVFPRGSWSTEIVEGMERQKDSFNCGVYVTA